MRYIFLLYVFISLAPSTQSQDINKILWAASWSPDGQFIAVGGADKVLHIYDGKTYEWMRNDTFDLWIQRLSWHPHKNILAVAANGDASCLINFDEGYKIKLEGLKGVGTRAIAWNPGGDKVAIADYEGIVHIYHDDGEQISSFNKENTKSYTGIAWHPKKDQLLLIGEYVREYSIDGTLLKKYLHRPHRVLLLSVSWHPSGNMYVLGDYGDPDANMPPMLQFYNPDHQLIRESLGSSSEYRNIAWSPDGSKLATAGNSLQLWSNSGDLLYSSEDDEDNLWGIAFNPTGTKIVTSSEKGHIRVWNDRGDLLKTLL